MGGDEMRMWTSRAPPFRSSGTSCASVLPRTSESSTRTTDLPARTCVSGLYLQVDHDDHDDDYGGGGRVAEKTAAG